MDYSGQMMLLVLAGVLAIGVFLLLAYGIVSFLTAEESPVQERLKRLKQQEETVEVVKSSGDLKEAFLNLVEPFSKTFYGQNANSMSQIKRLLTEAGRPDNDDAVMRFYAIRGASGVTVGALLAVPAFLITSVVMPAQILAGIMGALVTGVLIGGMIPNIQLRSAASKRKSEIRFGISDTLDLMVICVEAGLGLDATIQRVGDEIERMCPDLSQEFKRTNKELNAGIPRSEAFHNLGSRSGVEELQALCALIVQSDKLGSSVANTLRIYADDVRVKRKQKAEELASKASIKMTFPLVLFIFPPIFIVLIGPTVISAFSTFMSGNVALPK